MQITFKFTYVRFYFFKGDLFHKEIDHMKNKFIKYEVTCKLQHK